MVYNKEWRKRKEKIDEAKAELLVLYRAHRDGKMTDKEYKLAQAPFFNIIGTAWLHQ